MKNSRFGDSSNQANLPRVRLPHVDVLVFPVVIEIVMRNDFSSCIAIYCTVHRVDACMFVFVGVCAIVFAWVWVGKLVDWWVGGLACAYMCIRVYYTRI